jgi:hypothetical protein
MGFQKIWSSKIIKAQSFFEKNGHQSRSRRTSHVNIWYFFVTDRIQSKELTVEYCPTGNMLPDMYQAPIGHPIFVTQS